ncbi:MAG: Peptidyl-tRNA hydrolase [Bacteroidetes bacterium ADurb.Bin408]|nr:MAG: Peptidyl-tRNA hydrolase [Bacteroidetes bacterium ADurb.Bin408]
MTKFLIAGLGNIGAEYANTRHNIGFSILDAVAAEEKLSFELARYAHVARFKSRGKQFVLIKPTTYMNLSGKAVAYWLQAENISLENLLVVVDDVALELGAIRIRPKGGDGGHNGLIHIIETLKSENFVRLRFGIGNNYPKGFQVDYVLGAWSDDELKILEPRIKLAASAVKHFGYHGLESTMTTFSKK